MAGAESRKISPLSPPRIRGSQGEEPSVVAAVRAGGRAGDCLFPQSGICDKIRVFGGKFYSPRVFAKNFLEFSGQEAVEREKDKFVYSDEP